MIIFVGELVIVLGLILIGLGLIALIIFIGGYLYTGDDHWLDNGLKAVLKCNSNKEES